MKRPSGLAVINGVAVLGVASLLGIIGTVATGQAHEHRVVRLDVVEPGITPPTTTYAPEPSEDDPTFNCLTDGNRTCGPDWQPLPEEVYPDLGVSDDEQCVWLIGDTTTVACSDGQVFTS